VPRVEFFLDLSSPWTYLAFINVQPLLARTGADIRYRPILVGGVFNAVNPAVYAARENPDTPRMRHSSRMLHAWAAWSGVTLRFPSPYHPVKSVHAMRMACALEDDQVALHRFARAASQSDVIKARLRANTDELIARGGYGSPTLFVDRDAMYFGNDQLPVVEFALQGGRKS
jgi:2-hydroxychromene-2-carboxylate isomerase